MKKWIAILSFAGAIALAGCGKSTDSNSDIGQAYVTDLGQVADALESVKDEDSARAAAHKISQVSMRLEDRARNIESMTQTEQVMIVQKHAAEMAQLEGRINQAMQNIVSKDPKLLDILGNELQNMPQLK